MKSVEKNYNPHKEMDISGTDLSGNHIIYEGEAPANGRHNLAKLYEAMRENCVNKDVKDQDLWREWRQLGGEYYDDTKCICGVTISHVFTMRNMINGRILSPIGSKCILNAIGQGYNCKDCKRNFITQIPKPAIDRRMKENHWVCPPCWEKREHDLWYAKEVKMSIYNGRYSSSKYAKKKLAGISFQNCDEQTYNWVMSLPKRWGAAEEFIEYWEEKKKLENQIQELENKGF